MMRFAIVRQGEVCAVYNQHKEAVQGIPTSDDHMAHVMPIMTLDDFLKTHTDFRGLLHGAPSILYLDSNTGGTVLSSVYLIESWEAFQHNATGEERRCRYREMVIKQREAVPMSGLIKAINDYDGSMEFYAISVGKASALYYWFTARSTDGIEHDIRVHRDTLEMEYRDVDGKHGPWIEAGPEWPLVREPYPRLAVE